MVFGVHLCTRTKRFSAMEDKNLVDYPDKVLEWTSYSGARYVEHYLATGWRVVAMTSSHSGVVGASVWVTLRHESVIKELGR